MFGWGMSNTWCLGLAIILYVPEVHLYVMAIIISEAWQDVRINYYNGSPHQQCTSEEI